MQPLPENDLNHILEHTRDLWEEMRGERLFITGGTGFFGSWLLESFLWANQRLNLSAKATILSRDPEKFLTKMPHLVNHTAIQWIRGDICKFDFPEGSYAYVIHAATEASAQMNQQDPQRMFDTIVDGTRRTIEFAATHQTKKFLLTSSGAVYGKQPQELSHIPEDYQGAPDPMNPLSAYAEGKRAAEFLCAAATQKSGVEIKIARCFAFVGPHLPFNAHYAIGNFMRDALCGGPIIINGDGKTKRSYLYAADLSIWLWRILIRGEVGQAYNVGSDEVILISELANLVKNTINPTVELITKNIYSAHNNSDSYVPLTEKAKKSLGLQQWIDLETAVNKTVNYSKGNK